MPEEEDDILDPTLRQYGGYTPLVRLFGEPIFALPHGETATSALEAARPNGTKQHAHT